MVFAIHLVCDVVAKVNRDQMILFVVHVVYVIVPEVYHDHMIVFIVHVDCGVFCEVYRYQKFIIRSPRGPSHCLRGIS